MKKTLYSCLLISILFTGKVFAQGSAEKKGWPSAERYSFITDCMGNAKKGMNEDAARYYCYCMQEYIERKYPAIEEAAKLTEADLNTPEMKKEIQDCLVSKSSWSSADRSDFLASCIESAKAELSEEKAKNYCGCTLFKMEKKYPKVSDATALTEKMMQTPEFKKMIAECMAF